MSNENGLLARADIVNVAAILSLILLTVLMSANVYIVLRFSIDKEAAFKDVLLWILPILLNILATYGIVKNLTTRKPE